MLLQSIVQYFAHFVDIVEFQWILMVSILAVSVVVLPLYSSRSPPAVILHRLGFSFSGLLAAV
jgi:hypothetical protein